MNKNRRRAIQLAVAMSGTSVFAELMKAPDPRSGDGAQFQLSGIIPSEFGEWRIDKGSHSFVRAATRGEKINRFYDQLLELTFVNTDGYRVMLSVASSIGLAGLQLHWPEVCYGFSGYRVDDIESATLTLAGRDVQVKHLRTELPGRKEPVTYWSVVAGKIATEFGLSGFGTWDFRWQRLALAMRRTAVTGTLVRLSSIDSDSRRAYAVQAGFADAMALAIAPDQQSRIIGAEVQT